MLYVNNTYYRYLAKGIFLVYYICVVLVNLATIFIKTGNELYNQSYGTTQTFHFLSFVLTLDSGVKDSQFIA